MKDVAQRDWELYIKRRFSRLSYIPHIYGKMKVQGETPPLRTRYHFHEEEQTAHEEMTIGSFLLFGLPGGATMMDLFIVIRRREKQPDGI